MFDGELSYGQLQASSTFCLRLERRPPPTSTPGPPPLAQQLGMVAGSIADVAWFAIGILRHQLLPMVRVDALNPAKTSASTRSHSISKISAQIPLKDFLVSANIPTGLGCGGLF
jgi:hypothetical protein